MILLLIHLIFQSTYGKIVNINEETNFYPCSFTNGVLKCDGRYISNFQFSVPSKAKIAQVELVNLPLVEIPDNYMTPLAADLLSIKIHSEVSIKMISPTAFVKCSKVTSLEMKSQLINNEKSFQVNDIFHDLTSLEDLKLINLNIFELNLNYLQNLKSLRIENCYLTTISTDTFENNKKLSTLSITGLKNATGLVYLFENWPIHVDVSINNLKLESCNLRYFPKFSKSFVKNLTYLSLSRNPIENVLPSATKNLTELQVLILSFCKFASDTMNGLEMLSKLKTIDLANMDSLHDLPREIEKLENLEAISIELSAISQLSIVLPSSVEKITASYLSDNIRISANFLSKCNKLKFLSLDVLKTTDIKFLLDKVEVFKDSLRTLSLVESLFLEEDLWKVIKVLTKLETLYLDKSRIKSIPDEVLNNLVNLKKLTLNGNHLTYDSINTIGFQNISQHLLEIDLSENHLAHLPPCLFYVFPTLKNVNLLKNVIECDSNLLWLYEKIRTSSVVFPLLNFTCKTTDGGTKSLYELSERDLENPSSKIPPCVPLKTGFYKITFRLAYLLEESKIRIDNINGSHFKFLFDHMDVSIKYENKSFHSDVVNYELNQTLIEIGRTIHSETLIVCLTLVRKHEEYRFDYNCRSVAIVKVIKQSYLMWISISLAVIVAVIILLIVIIFCCRKSFKKRNEKQEIYSNCSSKYSEPGESYQDPDQYTEIISDKEYSVYPFQHVIDTTFPVKKPSLYHYHKNRSLKRMTIQSKSVDGGLDINHLPGNISKFQKGNTKSSRNLGKRQMEFQSLHSVNKDDGSVPEKYMKTARSSLPQQYLSRDLPILPGSSEMHIYPLDLPPPKPKFPSTDIKSLLNNADSHLNYFRQYASNNSFCTDKLLSQPYNEDNSTDMMQLNNLSKLRLSKDNSVII